MRKEIMMMGLAGLLYTGCDEFRHKSDVSKTKGNIDLTKPADCETVEDIRYRTINYDNVPGTAIEYQVLCSDKEKNLTLYVRDSASDSWQRISVR